LNTVSVKLNREAEPVAFVWRTETYHIAEILERWRLVGAWWDGEGEYTFFRVRATSGGFYELCYDHRSREWRLSTVQD